MPTYQYACTECSSEMEVVQSFSEDSLTVCPECEGRLRKVYSAVGIVFKGSGFYRTDSNATSDSSTMAGSGKNGDSESSESSGGGSASGDSAKSESAGSGSGSGSDSASTKSDSAGSSGSSGGAKETKAPAGSGAASTSS